jgi:hypothetical protein|tara:strand:+ start:102 stop:476 length:375 start_codon:yes stop_codon:yes gene_type:complete
MKKIISGIIMGMFSTIAVALFSVSATADDHYEFWPSAAPIICGQTKPMLEFVAEAGMQPLTVSFGKVDGKEDGEIAFVVTMWMKPSTTQQMVTISKPDGTEVCILYKSFNTTVNPNFSGKGINL